jgi:hypothetical protein
VQREERREATLLLVLLDLPSTVYRAYFGCAVVRR